MVMMLETETLVDEEEAGERETETESKQEP